MRDFFSLDGAFNKYGGILADTIILSFMWFFFSIVTLGIGVGASTTAMFFVTTRRIADRENYITSDFWSSFKENFKRATIIWLIIFVIGILLVFNIWNIATVGNMAGIVLAAQIVFVVQLTFFTIFIFPMTARFEMPLWMSIKSCFFMANRHLLTSITCTLLLAILLFVGGWLIWFIIFIPGLYAMLASMMIMRIFKKYRPEMDRDPILETQELEAKKVEERRRQNISMIEDSHSQDDTNTNEEQETNEIETGELKTEELKTEETTDEGLESPFKKEEGEI